MDLVEASVPLYAAPDPEFIKHNLLSQMLFLNRTGSHTRDMEILNELYLGMKPLWTRLKGRVEAEIRRLRPFNSEEASP